MDLESERMTARWGWAAGISRRTWQAMWRACSTAVRMLTPGLMRAVLFSFRSGMVAALLVDLVGWIRLCRLGGGPCRSWRYASPWP